MRIRIQKFRKIICRYHGKMQQTQETMQRTHERKMETFYHLENLDLEKEEFVKLRINVERQSGQGIKRKRKRKRH